MLLIDHIISSVLADPIALWTLFFLVLLIVGAVLAKLLPVKETKVKTFDGGKSIASKTYKRQYFGGGK